MPKLKVTRDISLLMAPHAHGSSHKIGVCLHETVSENHPGVEDVVSVANYLAHGGDGYAIHGITDDDGNIFWTEGRGRDIYYHCKGGHTNTNYLGIEQVSRVMVDYKTRAARIKAWLHMTKEINATAKLIACAARAWNFPIVDTRGNTDKAGVTTHYDVTQHFHVPGGHVDAWPSTRGGYFPLRLILKLAKRYYALGYHF